MSIHQQEEIQPIEIFQENYVRSPKEETLYKEWRKAMVGWTNSNNENQHLKSLIDGLQIQVNELRNQLSSGTTVGQSCSSGTPEYKTDDEELAQETEWIRVKHKSKKRKKMDISLTPPPKQNTPVKLQPKKDPIPPPIIVERVDSYETLYSVIKEAIDKSHFQVKFISENSAKINTVNSESYRAAVSILEKENLTFHTYENKQSRPIRVMIKQLHYTCKPESIVESLSEQGFVVLGAVNKLSFKKKSPLNMFMVTFENNQDINQIYKITHVLGCRVNVEAIKGSKLIAQCKKCQAYGHTKAYCSRQVRCVKCAGKHPTAECNKGPNVNAKCVNCGGTHPANYRGCIVAKELQMIRNKKLKIKPQPANTGVPTTSQNPNIQSQPGVQNRPKVPTYASVTASSSKQQSSSDPLIMILEKMSNMEHSITSIRDKVHQLESRINHFTSSK